VSPQHGLEVALVVMAAHNPGPWEKCLTGLDLRRGPGFAARGPAGGRYEHSRIFERGMARLLLSERTGPGGQDSITEVRFWVPDIMSARERAIAAGAEALSELRRGCRTRYGPDAGGMFEEAALGGMGIKHALLAATGSVAARLTWAVITAGSPGTRAPHRWPAPLPGDGLDPARPSRPGPSAIVYGRDVIDAG